jgi:ribosomal protein S18 acetylase RimI-like enzyme
MAAERTPPAVTIREFRPADYDDVMALWQAVRLPLKPQGRDSRENIERQLDQPTVIFLVAETAEGRVVGTVLATHDGRKGWINRLAVAPDLQRAGLGRRLIEEAEARLGALGLGIIAALIEDDNPVSMAVFERLGYVRHPEILYFAKRKSPGA